MCQASVQLAWLLHFVVLRASLAHRLDRFRYQNACCTQYILLLFILVAESLRPLELRQSEQTQS